MLDTGKFLEADFLVLCGGLGTRLRSVTGDVPKVMAKVQGEPFLDFLIRYLVRQGARRIILCAGYKAEDLTAYYKDKFPQIDLDVSIEPGPLGTGGAFKNAQSLVRSDMCFGLNGDCFSPVNYADFLAFAREKKALAALVGVKVDNSGDFGTIEMSAQDEITAFREKSLNSGAAYISAGIYCFRREIFDAMPPSGKFSIEYDIFPRLIGRGFYGFKSGAPFVDIGTPERFEWARNHLNAMLEGDLK